MENAKFERLQEEEPLPAQEIVPVYPRIGSLTTKSLRRIVNNVFDVLHEDVGELLPCDLRNERKLPDRFTALRNLHRPPGDSSIEDLNQAQTADHRALAYEELLVIQLGLLSRRSSRRREPSIAFRIQDQKLAKLISLFPFTLTAAQNRVLHEIVADMKAQRPMNRLLLGDVGCGKTAVALLACLVAVHNQHQAAIMAPTSVLADQHYKSLMPLAKSAGIRMTLITGTLSASEGRNRREAVAAGLFDLVVGTHALIQKSITFKRLGLVIVDEQHRFGVLQRSHLIGKGMHPDVLVMTATPIPRSLALTLYGDMDLSIIDELPRGRRPVKTMLVSQSERDRVYERLRQEIRGGGQVFFVYPLVEESPEMDLRDAEHMARELSEGPFRDFKVGLLHGRLPAREKQETLRQFAEGSIEVIVATTVIEVGIDVPQATSMVVEHAERFGLSQLHQLRGRVGRGKRQSSCLLFPSAGISADSLARLRVLCETSNGFRVAERDLALRGPGELSGTRQAGISDLKVANLVRHASLLEQARIDARDLLETEPEDGSSTRSESLKLLLDRFHRRHGLSLIR